MSDDQHVNFIAVPKRVDFWGRGIGEKHRRYTRMKNFAEGVRGYFFQGRFSSCVLDGRHLLAATSYVELNPVWAGIVKKAWAYPWSSVSFHAGWSKTDPLVKDRKLLNLVNKWDEFLAGATRARDEAIRQMTRTGRPAGDAAFVGLVERLTARNLTKGKPGRAVKKGR